MLRVLLRGGPRGPTSTSATTSPEEASCIMDDSSTATTTTTPSAQMKPTLAEAVPLPLSVANVMNVVAMKATTIATKEDRKEKLIIEEEDDRVEGEDDEDVDMDSPRYKKPRREEVELQKKREHEINEHMDTHSEEESEEPLGSFLFNILPPELVVRVLHYLPVRDLARASQTCSLWYSLAQEDQIWRSLFHYARHQHLLECSPSERAATSSAITAAVGGEGRRRGSVSTGDGSWKARFKDTYSVKRKFWFGSNEAFVHLDRTSFRCSEDEDEEQFLTGEVVLNIYSESITTHGLYLALVGEECFKAIDAESLSMNATEEKRTLVEIYVPLSGNTEWSERKKNKHMFFRGTYHYPFRLPIPRKTIADLDLPPSFNRRVKTSSGFFRVTYHAYSVLVLSFPHSNMTSRKHPLRFRLSDRMENRLRTKVMRKYSAPITDRLTHNSFNYIFFQKSGNVGFEVELQKQYFFINAEEMKIGVRVDNSQGRFPIHSITVALIEVLQERGNGFCREVVERRGSRRVYGEADGVQVAKGEVRRDIELYYPVTDANAKGGSLFNCALFQQRFAVCVSLNIFGCVDPRIEIPLFVLRVPS